MSRMKHFKVTVDDFNILYDGLFFLAEVKSGETYAPRLMLNKYGWTYMGGVFKDIVNQARETPLAFIRVDELNYILIPAYGEKIIREEDWLRSQTSVRNY